MIGTFEPLVPRDRRIEVDERMDAQGNVVRPLDEAAVAAAARALDGQGLRERRHPLPALVCQPGARAARRRDRARAVAQRLRDARPRAPVRVPRVRARHDGLRECGGAADPRPLRAPAAGRAGGARLRPRPAGHERQRRHRLLAPRRPRRGQDGDVRAGLGRDCRGGDPGPVGPRQRHHLRHGRHLHRRGADPRRRAGGVLGAGHRLRPADPRADGGRALHRGRRRLHRVAQRGRRAEGGAGVRPARRRGRSATAAAAPSPPSPTPTWCSAGSIRLG